MAAGTPKTGDVVEYEGDLWLFKANGSTSSYIFRVGDGEQRSPQPHNVTLKQRGVYTEDDKSVATMKRVAKGMARRRLFADRPAPAPAPAPAPYPTFDSYPEVPPPRSPDAGSLDRLRAELQNADQTVAQLQDQLAAGRLRIQQLENSAAEAATSGRHLAQKERELHIAQAECAGKDRELRLAIAQKDQEVSKAVRDGHARAADVEARLASAVKEIQQLRAAHELSAPRERELSGLVAQKEQDLLTSAAALKAAQAEIRSVKEVAVRAAGNSEQQLMAHNEKIAAERAEAVKTLAEAQARAAEWEAKHAAESTEKARLAKDVQSLRLEAAAKEQDLAASVARKEQELVSLRVAHAEIKNTADKATASSEQQLIELSAKFAAAKQEADAAVGQKLNDSLSRIAELEAMHAAEQQEKHHLKAQVDTLRGATAQESDALDKKLSDSQSRIAALTEKHVAEQRETERLRDEMQRLRTAHDQAMSAKNAELAAARAMSQNPAKAAAPTSTGKGMSLWPLAVAGALVAVGTLGVVKYSRSK